MRGKLTRHSSGELRDQYGRAFSLDLEALRKRQAYQAKHTRTGRLSVTERAAVNSHKVQ
jgi:hypothetical protein